VLCLTACAKGTPDPVAPVAPLTPAQVQAFDRGIDFVATLQGLEGRWRDDWDRDLQTRVGAASLVALVTVRTLRTDTSPEQQVTYRLVAQVDRELVGKPKRGQELELAVSADELGFSSVHENIGRIADHQYVAYVMAGPEGSSWHLSPASAEVVSETESVISQLDRGMKQNAGEQVIVRTN
ncbi:MAG TPA: hypothetical protein VFX59_06795, partial [Polyangiales bacterium]|nr:hypothetical protein [Polyangiales bacterium]